MSKSLRRIFLVVTILIAMILSSCSGQPADEKPETGGDTSVEYEGYVIENGVITAYTGEDSETVTPTTAEAIGSDAFSWDMGNGENLERVTVTANIKTIATGAFAFTAADEIYMEEGVTTIEHSAFMDSYISDIWFPASVTEIGASIMETEEGLDGTKIHLVEGSPADAYFKENMPYGSCELVYDYK